ncbi:AAA family ATPase [Acinetobacter baumannii]|uniref:AAA family ATPase n=1 Tax=Acinetobacter baumannii TaxID=470 RepID=UPI00201C5BD8|nr:AAA family ATPase [Acinetobacter baumannii]MCL6174866.1 AAA family ATPase [Acinetobacter baumannii]MCL6180196.1 AAA family ATPase [Acinetobacter baumannii]MCL6188034.1 AAA family ATPase [Acinetobacter baumannii]MCL6207743.1 AAA family ATPase [Acinetobacter baumannii]MCL6211669.1 AAA family ATPase [Acinetobacter baumannii]
MRLDYLKIGSAKDSPTHQFKNLKDVCIDFDENESITVVIGWNGTGKSNVLEALAIIFRDLILKTKEPAFAYELKYEIGSGIKKKYVTIKADPDLEKNKYDFTYLPFQTVLEPLDKEFNNLKLAQVRQFELFETEIQIQGRQPDLFDVQSIKQNVSDQKSESLHPINISFNKFTSDESEFLPKFVFSYYSGLSTRMKEIFDPYTEKFDKKLRNGKTPEEVGFKSMFYALPIHSQFVLLAFLFKQDKTIKLFLENQLGIDAESGIESILFELRQPSWTNKNNDGDPRIWDAKGVVKEFLSELYNLSLAPIKFKRKSKSSLWNKKTREYQYLFLKDMASFQKLIEYKEPRILFRDLESTYISELIEAVHIRVKLKKNNDTVTFKELSEGEQQLLTVLGLLRFTNEEESLYLLDEPDTHLNPKWSVEYLKYLQDFMKNESNGLRTNSHIVLTTHNPIAIAELKKEQIQILRRNTDKAIEANEPDFDPRGMGYAGIITSDMFGLNSSLDTYTQRLLKRKQLFTVKKIPLTNTERLELRQINKELEDLGFRFSMRDTQYERYLKALHEYEKNRLEKHSQPVNDMSRQLKIAEEIIQTILDQNNEDQS